MSKGRSTDRDLDLAINGDGFYVSPTFTVSDDFFYRDGSFEIGLADAQPHP